IFLVAVGAGIGGAILGLGGGIIIVPALTLLLNLPIRFAIGASIVAVIAGSSGAAAAYLRDRMTNLKIGLALEVMATTGALTGGVMMYLAGIFSGLLGIGSGVFKVLAMDVAMRLPMKVSTSTSNFMVGVTAAASAGVYFARGDILPSITAPVALGVLGGAWVGTHVMGHLRNTTIRKLFIPEIG